MGGQPSLVEQRSQKTKEPGTKSVSYVKSRTKTSKSDLFEQPAFLYDIGDGSLLRALRLVDVLQSKQLLRSPVFHHTDLHPKHDVFS